MKFFHTFRGVEVCITALGYEYSPNIGIDGFAEIYAIRLDNGEPFEMSEAEYEEAHNLACRIEWESDYEIDKE